MQALFVAARVDVNDKGVLKGGFSLMGTSVLLKLTPQSIPAGRSLWFCVSTGAAPHRDALRVVLLSSS